MDIAGGKHLYLIPRGFQIEKEQVLAAASMACHLRENRQCYQWLPARHFDL